LAFALARLFQQPTNRFFDPGVIMKLVLVLGSLVALSASAAQAQTPDEQFAIGAMKVERHGDAGRPIVFIPGLSSGAYAWEDVVRALRNRHDVYVVTLPGFDGQPAAGGDVVAGTQQLIGDLIASRKLVKPVLVGHSLGGTLSIAFAGHHSDQIAGIVSVDGLPVLPGTENIPTEQRPQMAAAMKTRMAGMTRTAFEAQQKTYMHGPGGAIDPAKAETLALRSATSDPDAVTEYMIQLFALDLRKDLPRIQVPVLLMAPYNEADANAVKMTASQKTDYYQRLMAGTPNVQVVSVSPARHFAMVDQPQQVGEAIRTFLERLDAQ
jgi:pimeloyl-ACP methyl ester carboxylesterase